MGLGGGHGSAPREKRTLIRGEDQRPTGATGPGGKGGRIPRARGMVARDSRTLRDEQFIGQKRGNPPWATPEICLSGKPEQTHHDPARAPSLPPMRAAHNGDATGEAMKTGLVIAALAAALITGSTVSSQAIPAAPLSKSIQQNSSSLVEHVGYRGYRGYRRVGSRTAGRPVPRLPPCRTCTGVTGVSASTGLSAITDTEAIGVSACTGATAAIAGAELPCIATAAAGEILHASATDVEIGYGS